MKINALCAIVLVMLLAGCAGFGAPRQFVNQAELTSTRGEPSRVWQNDDGTRTLEYATQPYGTTCWMYTVDASGNVVEQFDALQRSNLARVKPGMSMAEVERLLGQYRSVQRFSRSNEEVFDWNIANEWPDLVATLFNVHMVDGKVVRTSQSFVYPQRWPFGFAFGAGANPYWGVGFGWPHFQPFAPHPW